MEQCQNVNDFINSNVFAKMSKDPVTWHLLLTNVQISRRGVRLPYDAQPLGRLKWFRVLVTRHVTAFWPWTDETCVIEYMRPSLSNHLQAFAFIVLFFFFFFPTSHVVSSLIGPETSDLSVRATEILCWIHIYPNHQITAHVLKVIVDKRKKIKQIWRK